MFSSEIVNFIVGLVMLSIVGIVGLIARGLLGVYFKVKREIEPK